MQDECILLHQAHVEHLDTMSGMCLETLGGVVDVWTLLFKQSNNFHMHYSAHKKNTWCRRHQRIVRMMKMKLNILQARVEHRWEIYFWLRSTPVLCILSFVWVFPYTNKCPKRKIMWPNKQKDKSKHCVQLFITGASWELQCAWKQMSNLLCLQLTRTKTLVIQYTGL